MRYLTAIFLMIGAAALAAPDVSKRPVGRPGSTANSLTQAEIEPSGAIRQPARGPDAEAAAEKRAGPAFSLRPLFRSRKAERAARVQRRLLAKGAVCGDAAIQGEKVGSVPGKLSGCGIKNAVRVRSVSGVTLSQSALIDCTTANALRTWIDNTAKPALRKQGGGLSGLKVAAHYACRTRNNRKGAKISEHGRGKAIDISAFYLRDGTQVTVLNGWKSGKSRAALRAMHKGACGPFGTVLGPKSDRFHQDHFHFDTAKHRGGSYCR
ncbi:MAG: extensin family protein [Sulfitobacter sp.]